MSIELGTRTCRSLMSRGDWQEVFEVQIAQDMARLRHDHA